MKPSTHGEKLFLLIKNEILPTIRGGGLSWNGMDNLFSASCGEERFSHYIKGATTIYNLKRLMIFWKTEKPNISTEVLYVNKIASYIGHSMFSGLDIETRKKIARSVVAAEQASYKKIPANIEKKYKISSRRISCYLCNYTLNPSQSDENQPDFFTLDHIWPTSMGGDSIDENLLPACQTCQGLKKNFLSWEWINLQNAVFSIDPGYEELKGIPWGTRIAKHYFDALSEAESGHIRLKDAFQRIGPITTPISFVSTSEPITFFDLKTS